MRRKLAGAALLIFLYLVYAIPYAVGQSQPLPFGNSDTNTVEVDWPRFWNLFNNHSDWDLEYNAGAGWISRKQDLEIIRDYRIQTDIEFLPATKENGTCVKITLNFTASYAADYRLTFGIDLDVKNYTYKTGAWNYTLVYQNYTVFFDWSDIQSIPGLIVSHGVMPVGDESWFWFRIRRDNVPQGANLVIDPIFGNPVAGGTWLTSLTDRIYACHFNISEAGTMDKLCLFAGDNENNNEFRMGMYSATWMGASNRWQPDAVLGEANGTAGAGSNRWNNLTVSISVPSEGVYYIAWKVESNWGGKYDASSINNQTAVSTTGQGDDDTPLTDPWPATATAYYAYNCSVFGEYTTEAGQELTFTLYSSLVLHGGESKNVEVARTTSSSLALHSGETMNKEVGFSASNSLLFYASHIFGREYGFLAAGTLRLWDGGLLGRELSFLASNTLRLWSSAASSFEAAGGFEVAFTVGETLLLHGSAALGREHGFLAAATLRFWGYAAESFEGVGFEAAFTVFETLFLSDVAEEVLVVAIQVTWAFGLAALALVVAFAALSIALVRK